MSGELRDRTKAFAIEVIWLVEKLPNNSTARVIGNQLLRSGTSVGANYRAASRARSKAEFVAKLGIVEEECDESIYWIELLVDSNCIEGRQVSQLVKEANEILAMTVASIRTARGRKDS